MPDDPLLLLLLGCFLGHTVLMLRCHNWWYGQVLPRHFSKVVHLAHALLILTFPALFFGVGWWGGLSLGALLAGSVPGLLLGGYLACCLAVGCVHFPLLTWSRWRRGEPAPVREARGTVIDVADKLGTAPLGRGKSAWKARLPGNEIFQVEMVEKTIRLARIPPAWDGLTILHLSDLHLCGLPDRSFYRVVMEHCSLWQPDIVAVTGDIVDSVGHHGWIMPAFSWLRWRVAAFAILGNHDSWYEPQAVRRKMAGLGMEVLANRWTQIDVRGEPLVVIGQEAPWFRPAPDLSDCPGGPFRLCLSHTPDNLPWARRAGVDLMLAGHVHGGQVRFPVIGSVLVPSRYGRRYDCGTFYEEPTLMHVSRGLAGEHAFRYRCRPEVTLLRLQSR